MHVLCCAITLLNILGYCLCVPPSENDISETVTKLFETVRGMQASKTMQPAPPIEWGKFKGNYESDVKLYFHGNSTMSALRYMFKVFDNNMFATAWITSCLVEAHRYGKAPKPSEDQIIMAVDAIMNHRNKNLKYENSIMAFWPQILNTEFNVGIFYHYLHVYQMHTMLYL